MVRNVYVCLFFMCCTPVMELMAQQVGNCKLPAWDEVLGNPSYSPTKGECGYEVEDWDVPSYLGIEIGDLLDYSLGTRIFRYRLHIDELDFHHDGQFISFEWVAQNEAKILQIGLSWVGNRLVEPTTLTTKARVFPLRTSSTGIQQGVFGSYETTDLLSPLNLEVLWNPSEPGAANGSLEFRVNGQFAGRKDNVDLGIVGSRARGYVRYGYIEVSTLPPQGSLWYVPQNPTPSSPHL